MIFLSFFVSLSAVMSFLGLHTYLKLLRTRQERDEARERLRHATSDVAELRELMETDIRRGQERRSRIDLFRETERGKQAVAAYRKSWN